MGWLRRRRRRQVRSRPFPPEWEVILGERAPYFQLLSDEDRAELREHILVFLEEKSFEGCNGMVVTDEVRVVVAAHACLLLLHRETDYFPQLDSILIYPEAYEAETERSLGDYIREEGTEVRVGESWQRGVVILSWDEVCFGVADVDDGQNVVLHEFAHQLDDETGIADGTPVLGSRVSYDAWVRTFGSEYEALCEIAAADRPSLIDPYGAESPAEFFAVVTESFFEMPLDLLHYHPDLYRLLEAYYVQDPALRYQ